MIYSLKESIKKYQDKIDNKLDEIKSDEEEKYKALEEKVEKRTVTYKDIKNIFQEIKKTT